MKGLQLEAILFDVPGNYKSISTGAAVYDPSNGQDSLRLRPSIGLAFVPLMARRIPRRRGKRVMDLPKRLACRASRRHEGTSVVTLSAIPPMLKKITTTSQSGRL